MESTQQRLKLQNVRLDVGSAQLLIRLVRMVANEMRPQILELRSVTVSHEQETGETFLQLLQLMPIHSLIIHSTELTSAQWELLRDGIHGMPELSCVEFHGARSDQAGPPESIGRFVRALLNKQPQQDQLAPPQSSYKIAYHHYPCKVRMLNEIESGLKECTGEVENIDFVDCCYSQSQARDSILRLLSWLEGAPETSTLKRIDLRENELQADHTRALASLLESHPNLESLSLEGNEDLFHSFDEAPGTCFCRSLQNHRCLKHLRLTDCNIDADCAQHILNALKHCRALKILELDNNTLHAGTWVECIPELTSLETIFMPEFLERHNGSWDLVVKALRKSTSLIRYERNWRFGLNRPPDDIQPILERNRLLICANRRLRSHDISLSLWPRLLCTVGSVPKEAGTPIYWFLRAKHAELEGVTR